MRQTHPLVSVSILTYNGQKYIQHCLNSVLSQTYPRLEVLIIDNNSTDKTVDYLKKLPKKSGLRIIFNKQNIGFAAGHNQGIKESKGGFILCLNQDIVLDKNFIQKAVDLLKKDKKIAAVQGKLLRWNVGSLISDDFAEYEISRIVDTTGLAVFKNRRIINKGQGEIDQGQFEKIKEIFGADGAAPVYRREALEDVKIKDLDNFGEYFDNDFFCYKEDVDLAWRLRLYGWKSIYQPESIAWHDRTSGESTVINYFDIIRERRKINRFGKYHAFKNQRLMQIKNEQAGVLLRHLPWFLPKEAASWFYVLLFERYTWRAIKALLKQMPRAWQKRKIVMTRKKIGTKEMKKWFK